MESRRVLIRTLVGALALLAGSVVFPTAAQATYAGQNGPIAFISSGDVYVIGPNGGSAVNFTGSLTDGVSYVSVSPDGTKIAFTVSSDTHLSDASLYVARLDGSAIINATNTPGGEHLIQAWGPTWSPDGTRIAFAAYNDSFTSEVYVVNAVGTNLRQISDCDCILQDDETPTWYPGSDWVTWIHNGALEKVNATTGESTEVADFIPADPFFLVYRLSWSPDGATAVFSTATDTWRVDADGTALTMLTGTSEDSVGFFVDPVWSPDGTKLVVSSNHDSEGNQDLYLMDPATGEAGGVTRLTTMLGVQDRPDWGPLCTANCSITTTTLSVTLTRTTLRVIATGGLTPAVPGAPVRVSLWRRPPGGTTFSRVGFRDVTAADDGTFRARFSRPVGGTCQVRARFRGDIDHTPASAKSVGTKC